VLRPAIDEGRVIISDRYADATVAYQGAGRGFSAELISEIIALATEGLRPDLTLLFDLSVSESNTRTRRRTNGQQAGDRLDAENAEFHTRVRDAYLRLAETEPDRIKIIETDRSVEETQEAVRGIVVSFLKSRGHVRNANC
jgi:dTMP kinase